MAPDSQAQNENQTTVLLPPGPPEIRNNTAGLLSDRMMRYHKNPECPKCEGFQTVCMIKRPGYKLFRCRSCNHRWEIKKQKKLKKLKADS